MPLVAIKYVTICNIFKKLKLIKLVRFVLPVFFMGNINNQRLQEKLSACPGRDETFSALSDLYFVFWGNLLRAIERRGETVGRLNDRTSGRKEEWQGKAVL